MDELTNDAKFLLSMMYKEYVERRKNGFNKEKATFFNNETDISEKIMPEWKPEDVHFTIAELSREGFLKTTPASNNFMMISLTTKAIANLEITFADKVDAALEFAAKIKNAIPFV